MSGQINGVYDPSYFDTEGNEYVGPDNVLWWSSNSRNVSNGSVIGSASYECVEIDLTKKRTVNYISFDCMYKPVSIDIEYDCIDLDNIDSYSTANRWKRVLPVPDEKFDSDISYLSDHINPWKHCEFYFTDEDGNPLTTRRIKLRFTRRQEDWPAEDYPEFPWSVDVKNLRVGRYISRLEHLENYLIDTTSYSDQTPTAAVELRQRFYMKSDFQIGSRPTATLNNIDSFTPSPVNPKLSGFEFLINPKSETSLVGFDWSLYKIVNGVDVLVDEGNVTKTLTAASAAYEDEEVGDENRYSWLRIDFTHSVQTTGLETYEIRLKNKLPTGSSLAYTVSPNPHVSDVLISTDLIVSGATTTTLENSSLVFRVIADIGNYGKDLLGNEYREGVRYNSAGNAIDGLGYTNWTCFPNPSQDGVECLYLDIRKLVDGQYQSSVIDALEINTLTPGVKMNLYFSRQPFNGSQPPQDIDDWESILWTPVRESFKLNAKQIIDLPYPIYANWLCLEFYNLQAAPLGLTGYPILPEVEFKEFPQWVYDDNPTKIVVNDEPNLLQEKFVGYTLEEVFAPKLENRGDVRIYADTAQTLAQNIEQNGFGSASPVVMSQVSFYQQPYEAPSVRKVSTDTLLGSFVYQDYQKDYSKTYIAEAQQYPRVVNSRNVSNLNDRRLLARHDELNLLFNRVCAHKYSIKKARYNKKAYNVSVSEINLLRKDYTVERDDPVIHDVLVFDGAEQSILIESSTWEPEQKLSIPIGGNVYVTYTVNGMTYEDELVTFENINADSPSYDSVDLFGGGGIATSAIARSAAFETGETYYRDQDFVIVYDPISRKNQIKRNDIPARLVVGNVVNSIDKYTVVGVAIIDTETDNPLTDQVELGDIGGSIFSTGAATTGGLLSSGFDNTTINGLTQTYGTLTDPTD